VHDSAIGIFDSGIGGLTVFREIAGILPHEDLIYLGDTARVPYGTKSAETVTRYSLQNVRFLLEQKVKMAVVACNTASAFALEELRKHYPVPIVGVIEPGAKGALQATRSKRIGVIGTEGTIKSEAYARNLVGREPHVFVASAPCPLFVPLVEEGWLQGEVAERIAREYLQKLLAQKIDTLILGCTHYPLLKPTLQKVVGNEVALIDSAEETAKEVAFLLAQKGLMRRENKTPRREFFVTDSPERFRRVGEIFLKNSLKNVRHVTIEG
jgi:glutamate racemase